MSDTAATEQPQSPRAGTSLAAPDELDRGVDYTGAIYGSLLAASTIVGTATVGSTNLFLNQLLIAVIATSVVFWLLHVYVHVIGYEMPRQVPWLTATRRSAKHELPILLAVVPPATVLVIAMLVGDTGSNAAWWALWVAVAGQVTWTWIALRETGANRRVTLVSMAVSLALGLVLVLLKAGLAH